MISTRFSRLQAIVGIDFHVAVTLLFRSWGFVAGAVMVFAIPATLNPQQQGYYFTFASVLGLQIFFELGLNQVVVQLVSHEMSFLARTGGGKFVGEGLHVDRLTSIVSMLRKWYVIAALLFALVTALAGYTLFDHKGLLPRYEWVGAWLTLVLMTSFNLYYSPMLSVMEGCGEVGQVARLRLVQSMIGSVLTWAALFAGAGLWAISLTPAVACVGTVYWLRAEKRLLRSFESPGVVPRERSVDWRREVLPFQWRIAVSWISGYFMFQLFTPLVFVNLGPIAAGHLGIALSVFNAVLTVGVSWINAKVPSLVGLISRGARRELNALFRATVVRSTAFTVVASSLVLAGVYWLGLAGFQLVNRFPDLPSLICLAVVTLTNVFIYAAATFMRAHREEPMLPVSVVGAVVTLFAAQFGSQRDVFTTVLLYALVNVIISLPWTIHLFLGYYRRAEEIQ